MAWNSTFPKYKSTQLRLLDCGSAIKIPRQNTEHKLYASFTTPSTGMEIGTCVAMIRVFPGTTIIGAELFWTGNASGGGLNTAACYLGVGDPFACARFLGPVDAGKRSGDYEGSCLANTVICNRMTKVGPAGSGGRGDACGVGYTYTCETDIIVTNLYGRQNAAAGGWIGSDLTSGSPSTLATGTIVLVLDVIPNSLAP